MTHVTPPGLVCVLELYFMIMMMSKQSLTLHSSLLGHKEYRLLKRLNTPKKIQDYLNSLKFNLEKKGETHRSVRYALKYQEAHCFEGALIAAAALWINGQKPLILDLRSARPDFDHVVTIFKEGRYFGAISKTNHAVLRYREPVYANVRELVMSYFHEYFLKNGKKTLRSYSKPFDLSKVGPYWLSTEENLAPLAHKLDNSPHTPILTKEQIKKLRQADDIEIKAGNLAEYK